MMAFRAGFIVLLVSLATMALVARSAMAYPIDTMAVSIDGHGLVADSLDLDEEMMMESETARRQLRGKGSHIGYEALNRNRVPCNQRGQSYYNCRSHQRANPYQRGCTRASRCARNNR